MEVGCSQGRTEVEMAPGARNRLDWCRHVRTYRILVVNVLYWRKYLRHCWDFSTPGTLLSLTLVKTLATVGRLLADGAVAMTVYTAGFHTRLRSASNTSVSFFRTVISFIYTILWQPLHFCYQTGHTSLALPSNSMLSQTQREIPIFYISKLCTLQYIYWISQI